MNSISRFFRQQISIRRLLLVLLLPCVTIICLNVIRPVHAGTTYTVNSLADANDGACNPVGLGNGCTLREAIIAANVNSGADAINFSISGTITLNSQLPALTGDLTIDGAGQTIILDGANQHSVLSVSNVSLSLKDLTIANGAAESCGNPDNCFGGGLFTNLATVNITNCTFSNNNATGTGGAIIMVGNGGAVVITNSTFTNNHASRLGGAISADGNLNVTNSNFSGNTSGDTGGAIHFNAFLGVGSLNVSGSNFSGNSSVNGGGAIVATNGPVTITDSTFSGNSVTGAGSFGGGVESFHSRLLVTNSIFSNNTAGATGGGLFTVGTATVVGSLFSGNGAQGGGAIANFIDASLPSSLDIATTTFSGNTASSNRSIPVGGAVFNQGNEVTVTSCTFSGNTVFSGSQVTLGGAIYNSTEAFWHNSASLKVTNSTFSSNSCFSFGHGEAGGAIYNKAAPLSLTNSTLSGNSAGFTSATSGGGIYTENGTLTIKNTIIANNVGDCVSTSGTVTAVNNLIMENAAACGLTNGVNGNLIGFDPLLGPLANNGGPTYTFALGFGSPAIDAGADVTTLNGTIDNAVTSIVVADATAFPTNIGFAIRIDNEQMIVAGKTGNTLTVTRGANSTSVASHNNGAAVNPAFDQRLTAFNRKSGAQVDIGAFEHYPLAIKAATGIVRIPNTTANSQIATANYDGNINNVTVTVTSANPSNGVTISNIVNTSGVITADVAAAVGATTATFTLQATDGSLIATDTLTVTVCTSSPPIPTISGATNGTGTQDQACPEQPLTLTANSSGATSYQWYKDNNLILGQTNSTLIVNAAGTYSATAIAGLCPSAQSAGYLVQNPTPAKPLITPQGATTFCAGGSVMLQSNLATGIQWYKDGVAIAGANSQSYAATTSGSYNAQLNGLGCHSLFGDAIVVTVNPPTIAVTNANDSGAGSLRQAIADVCPGGTITFDMNQAASPITLTSGQLVINKNVTIQGPGANLLTVSGNQASRVFNVGSGVNVAISGLTMSNGKVNGGFAGQGGAIYNGGMLTLTNSTLSGNSVSDNQFDNHGGAIYNGGTLTLTNSTLSGNSVNSIDGSLQADSAKGGAIFSDGPTVTITNSTLSNNSASGDSSYGGAIAHYLGTLTLTNSTVSGNSVHGSGANTSGEGGAIVNGGTMMTITNSTLSGNSASSIFNAGGAISNYTTLTINNSSLSGNSMTGSLSNTGGAIFNNGGTLTLTSSTLHGNSVSGGSSINRGGGIDNVSGPVAARNTIISGNTADNSPDFSGPLTSRGHNLIHNQSGATITGDTTGNLPAGTNPQLGPLQNNGGPTQTMALLLSSPAIDAGDDCVFDNSCSPALGTALTTDQRGGSFSRKGNAHVDIGAYEVNGVLQSGGPSFVVNSIADTFDGACTAEPAGCTLREAINTANTVAGADTISFDPALTAGGATTITLTGALPDLASDININGPGANLLTVSGNQVTRVFNVANGVTVGLSGLTIANGNVTSGGGGVGGGIFNAGTLTITNCALSGNSVSGGTVGIFGSNFGGGILNGGTLTLTNTTLSANTASGGLNSFGGGIYNGGTLTITNSTLSSNSANAATITFGGAIYNSGGTVTLTNSTLSGNSASVAAGGIFNNGGAVNARNTIIARNTATDILGILTSQGHNLIGDTSGTTITGDTTGNILNQDPLLGSLATNGGPTQTMLLLAGSPGLDAGDDCVFNNSCSPALTAALTADQRGSSRKVGAHVDMGSVEINYSIAATAGTPQSATINAAFATQLQATVTDSGNPVSGATVIFIAPGSGASGTFPGNALFANVLTNASGVATAPVFTANGNSGAYTVTATGLGVGGTANFNLTNLKANQTIGFATLVDKTFGDPDFNVAATATSGLPVSLAAAGNCTVTNPSPGTVHIVNGGSCTITASQGGDASYNPAPNASQSFMINKANQTITFAAPANKTFGDPDFLISASSSSGLAVSLSATGNCTVNSPSPGMAHITGAGSCTIAASQAGNIDYLAAPNVPHSFTINKANQTITFAALANRTFGDPDFGVSATVTSGLPVSFAGGGNCTVSSSSPGTVHITGAGSCTITASQAGDANFNAAPDTPQSFTINKANQTITFAALANRTFGDPDFNVSATATSGLTVSLAASGNCTVTTPSPGTLHITGAGSCTITASQAGDANYNPATDVQQSFNIAKAVTSTAVTSSVNPSDFDQNVTFTATVTSGAGTPTATMQFKDNGTNLGSAVALNAGGVAQLATSTLTVGTHTITAEYTGEGNFLPGTGTLSGGQVVKAQPSISINDVSTVEGDAGTKLLNFTVNLSAASSLTVTTNYATVNSTATAPSDYLAIASTLLTFNPGDTSKQVSVTVNGDISFEADESFFLNLSNPVNATISDNQGLGTIQNDDVPGGFIAFDNVSYNVDESTGIVTLTVARTNDVSQAVNVDYATDDTGSSINCAALLTGLASQRCDYTSIFGTLKFAANESQKNIDIPINLDAYNEGAETFTVKLTNPTGGAVLAGPSTAAVTINDSVSPTPNPLDDTASFVRQQYRDFLNREVDSTGLTFWKNNIDKCNDPAQRPAGQTLAQCIEVQRILTTAAFFLSIEFKQTGGMVRDFYVATLDRPATGNMPDFVEFMRDTQAIQKGVTVGQGNWQQTLDANRTVVMNDFVTRAEFVALYPTTDTPTEYVDKLYLHANVTGTQQERLDAIADFGGAATAADAGARWRALLRVTQNGAFQARELNRAFVYMQYLGYLRRNPNDPPDGNLNGFNFWVNKLNQFNGDFLQAEMVKAFLSSTEYRTRFGP